MRTVKVTLVELHYRLMSNDMRGNRLKQRDLEHIEFSEHGPRGIEFEREQLIQEREP